MVGVVTVVVVVVVVVLIVVAVVTVLIVVVHLVVVVVHEVVMGLPKENNQVCTKHHPWPTCKWPPITCMDAWNIEKNIQHAIVGNTLTPMASSGQSGYCCVNTRL